MKPGRRRCPSCGQDSLRRVGRHLFYCPICEVYYRLDIFTGQIRAMNPLLSPPKAEGEGAKPKRPVLSLWHEFLRERGISPTTYKKLPPIVKEGIREAFREWRKRRMEEEAEEAGTAIYYPFGVVG